MDYFEDDLHTGMELSELRGRVVVRGCECVTAVSVSGISQSVLLRCPCN